MYSQKEKDGMAMKNATIDKFSARGGGDEPKISFVEDKDKTYTNVTYTKRPSYSDEDAEMKCGSSRQVPGCDKSGNAGKFRNYSQKLKTIENDTRIRRTRQELRQLKN
jgi:hypothetical protein